MPDPGELREACARWFADVELHGLFGSDRYAALVAGEHDRLDALLRRDPVRLRRLVPRRLRQRAYDRMLTRARRRPDPRAAAITEADFTLGSDRLEAALDVVAVCRSARAT